jgi:hypothetical protein
MSELINLATVAAPRLPAYTQRVAEATVRTQVGGQGVLVPGGFILTATHCLSWDAEHHHPENYITDTITTRDGRRIVTRVAFADPASDLAVLGAWDDQDDLGFGEWYGTVTPLPIAEPQDGTPVHVLTHLGEWMHGEIIEGGSSDGRFEILTDREIPAGTSGGSVVDDVGRVVGVVSVSSVHPHAGGLYKGKHNGTCPAVALALPQWLLKRIHEANE